MTHLIQ